MSQRLFDADLAVGSGYRTLDWVTQPDHALPLIGALFTLRLLATTATVAGGGVGGLFIPLVIAGALVGDGLAVVVHDETTLCSRSSGSPRSSAPATARLSPG